MYSTAGYATTRGQGRSGVYSRAAYERRSGWIVRRDGNTIEGVSSVAGNEASRVGILEEDFEDVFALLIFILVRTLREIYKTCESSWKRNDHFS